jgi:hypothetical protein
MTTPSLSTNTNQLARPIADLALPIAMQAHDSSPHLQLSQLRGRVIIIFVFGVDCSTCRHLAGALSILRQERGPVVECIGICVQSGCQERLPDFASKADVRFPLTYCSTRELCPALGIPKATWLFYPTVIFIDQEQRRRAFYVGNHDFFKDPHKNIRAVLDELLTESLQIKQEAEVSA